MKAMILAAGFGTRLFPLTIDRTKPAIPFLGKPLVGYVAEYIARYGFKDIIVNLHHQPESVKHALGDGSDYGVKIQYTLEEPKILGTAGALDNARHLLEDETFLIVNGKIITDIDIAAALETHRKTGALATMVLKENPMRERFTVVEIKDNFVTAFGVTDIDIAAALETHRKTGALATMVLKENPMRERFTVVEIKDNFVTGFGDFPENSERNEIQNPKSKIQNPLMFTGIHILEPRVFDYIPRGVYSDIVPTFYNPAIRKGEKIAAHITNGNWFELSTIPRYLDISLAMMNGKSVCKGENCSISANAQISNSVIWDDVVIESGARLNRTIIADGVTVKADETFENAAIIRADMLRHSSKIPEKALKGKVVGENYVVPLNQ